jgi:hypothetical protein
VVLVVVLPTWCGRCRLHVCEKKHVVGYHCGSTNYGVYSVRQHSNNCMALFDAGGEGDAKNMYNSKTTYEYNTQNIYAHQGASGSQSRSRIWNSVPILYIVTVPWLNPKEYFLLNHNICMVNPNIWFTVFRCLIAPSHFVAHS